MTTPNYPFSAAQPAKPPAPQAAGVPDDSESHPEWDGSRCVRCGGPVVVSPIESAMRAQPRIVYVHAYPEEITSQHNVLLRLDGFNNVYPWRRRTVSVSPAVGGWPPS